MIKRIDLNLVQSRLKIRQLVVFNTVVRERSILKAAEKLNVTQPAVTRTVRELESLFNCHLLERSNRGVTPTVFGEAFGQYAQSVICGLRHAMDKLNALHGADEGHVIVGTLISAAAQLLPRAIAALKQRTPRLVVTVLEGTNDLLLPSLANGEIDIVVGRIPDDASYFDVEYHVLYKESLLAMVSDRHPLATHSGAIDFASLVGYQWILPVSESPVRRRVQALFDRMGTPLPEQTVESLSIATNLGLLDTIEAIVLVPESVGRYYAALGGYHILEGLDLGEFGDVGYTVPTQRQLTPSAALFVDCLKGEARAMK